LFCAEIAPTLAGFNKQSMIDHELHIVEIMGEWGQGPAHAIKPCLPVQSHESFSMGPLQTPRAMWYLAGPAHAFET
jgi:hypothetical protein